MSMKTRDEKEKKRDLFTTIFWILVLVFLIVKIVIPETGVLGMVNEGSNAVLFFGIGGSCVWTIIHKRKTNKTAVVFGVLLLVLTLGIGGWISGKLVLDLISGPEVVRLTSVTMRESSGIYGLISRHYYLCGRDDEWTEYQMERRAGDCVVLPKNRADFKVFVILPTDIMYRIETGSPQASDNG